MAKNSLSTKFLRLTNDAGAKAAAANNKARKAAGMPTSLNKAAADTVAIRASLVNNLAKKQAAKAQSSSAKGVKKAYGFK